jgi:hypothetical protein
MFLILPRSMIISEIPEQLQDTDLEDWLTTENASQQPLRDLRANGTDSSPSDIADLCPFRSLKKDAEADLLGPHLVDCL